MNIELGPIEKYANNSSFTKSIQYLPRSKSPEPNSCLRSVQGSRYGLLPQRRRMPFRFRWAKTANRKTPSKRFDCRTVLSKNQFGAHDRRETVWRRRSGLSSIYMIRIWLQIGPDARNNAKQADDVVQDLGTSRKPAAFDNADGPIWTVGEKGFLHHPKKFQEVARPTKAFFRASLT